MPSKTLKLRRDDRCVVCRDALVAGTLAVWDSTARTVTCRSCAALDSATNEAAGPPETSGSSAPKSLDRGEAGRSAQREYDRRRERRECHAKQKLGRLSGIYLALSNEPDSMTAWARGSRGEKLLGDALERLHGDGRIFALHDRRIPRSRTNIDHVAITPSGGVWAIDAKNYSGKVKRIDRGGWFSTDERLVVGSRDCSSLVEWMRKQTEAIRAALGQPVIAEFTVEIKAAICFVDAEWSLFARPFALDGVWIGWLKTLCERLVVPGDLDPEQMEILGHRVAAALPPA